MADVFDDLRDEYEQLDAVLTALAPEQWAAPSAAAGWSVGDVVLHLAQTEELALASAAGGTLASFGGRVDALADDL
ncbi:MAG: maleylpyruvate isomerase family mycothiol-dependent enzyme, partial [Nonomuraea sp.]|nr:maleylpyruvate isomerase family mycothiol-dependent enzyme [Nonomuraea sp.]